MSLRIGWRKHGIDAMIYLMPTIVATYPDYKESVEELVKQHRKLRNGQLHLAVYLAPAKRPKRDICLFEVIDDFGGGQIDRDKKLFTFAYGSTPGFPLPAGVHLWMILTNPAELENAIKEDWPRVDEIRDARNAGKTVVLHADATGKKLWNKLK